LSRKRTFALLAAFAALAALLGACGGGGGGSSEDPQKVIEQATFEGVESGDINLTMTVKSTGEHGGNLKVDLSGPFQSTGKKSLPELALALKATGDANGEKVDFEGGITALADRAYIGYKGKQFEVDPTTFGIVKSSFEQAEQEGEKESKGGEATACQNAATSLDLEEFVDHLENEGGEEVEGVKTTKLSGDLDPKGAVDAVIKLLETPACSAELEAAGPLPLQELKGEKGELTEAIKRAHVEVFVGEDDHIVRKVVADLTVEPKGSGEKAEIDLDFTLGKVNEKQTIKAPPNAESLDKLLSELGINPADLLGLMEGGESFGSLIEGIAGEALGGGSAGGGPELELPAVGGKAKAFQECLGEAESASDVQKCTSLME
jgi:hypothetical protein